MLRRYISFVALLTFSSFVSCKHDDRSSPQEPFFPFQELLHLQKTFWDNFLYPADVKQAKSINSTILAEDVLGRIDITRTFEGRELNTEYLFGLFANIAATPNSITLLGIPISYEIIHFAANQNIASASTRFMFNITSLHVVVPIVIDTWITWNSKKEISQYDVIFKWWPWAVEYLIEQAAPKLGATSATQAVTILTQALAGSICTTAQTFCKDANQQYASAAECTEFLTTKVPFGPSYLLGKNTLLCRMVHQNMVPFRPNVHCPHIGKTGGGYCTDDITYVGAVTADYFKNAAFVPFGAK